MGYGAEVDEIGRLFRAGRRAEALAAVPDEMVRETMIAGTPDEVREQFGVWADAGVTTLMVTARDVDTVRRLGALVR